VASRMTTARAELLFRSARPITDAADLNGIHLDMLASSPVSPAVTDAIATVQAYRQRSHGLPTPAEWQAIDECIGEFNARRQSIAATDRLERELRDVGKQHQPDRDWQAKVWRRIQRATFWHRVQYRAGRALLVAAFLLACVAAAVVIGAIGGLLSLRCGL
jgi:hypothetical protein